jgi:hypothetical protein
MPMPRDLIIYPHGSRICTLATPAMPAGGHPEPRSLTAELCLGFAYSKSALEPLRKTQTVTSPAMGRATSQPTMAAVWYTIDQGAA